MHFNKLVALAIALLCVPATVNAQSTGSVSGAVFDQAGSPIADAAVRIVGDQLPAGRTSRTSDSGLYSFTLLMPGTYSVSVEKEGIGKSSRPAVVEVGKDTQLDLVVGVTVQESLTVVAATPEVDVKSTEVAFNFKADDLQGLPLERNYRGLFQLIPGVADNRSTVGPSAGGTRQDNTYLIDGVNITNPGFGYLSTEVNELDIAEVNIKRAGITAEFGRTGGAVTNAVSRSGSNRFAGIARVDWLPEGLIADFEESAFRDPLLTTVVTPGIGIGGPIIRDRLFFYGSARYFTEAKWERVNKLDEPLPDEERKGHELYGKLTAPLGQRHMFNIGLRDRPNDLENALLTSSTRPGIATTSDNSSRVANASWGFFVTNQSALDVKYLFMKENNEDDPITNLGYLPTPFNAANPALMGQYEDPTIANVITGGNQYTNRQNYRRHEAKATYSHFLDLANTSHDIKVGGGYEFGEENLSRLANGWGVLVAQTLSGQPVIRARYYPEQPAQLGQGRTWSLFVQDSVTIGNRLSVNAGVLMNRDEYAQDLPGSNGCPTNILLTGGAAVYDSSGDTCTFLRFNLTDEIQPRLGASYNLRRDAGDKIYANWGRYNNMDQKSSGRSLAPRRIFQNQAFFDLQGNLISDAPLASTTGKLIDPDIKPIYSDEVLVGYATPFGQQMSVDVFFMYRDTKRFIDDVPSRISGTAPDSGPYAAANLPCDRFASCRDANAERTYKAFTVEVGRRLADKWSGSVSYTWSRFEGNYDLDGGGATFNTSSIIQDGPGTDVQEPFRFGPLRQDRPHVFKILGTWLPTERWTFGGYFRAQSGAPWGARGRDTQGSVQNYLEAPDAHRNPTWANLDLRAAYRLPLNGRASVSVEARVLNVFGNQTTVSTDAQQFLDFNRISIAPFIGPYTTPNPFFGEPNQYAPPRRLVLGASLIF